MKKLLLIVSALFMHFQTQGFGQDAKEEQKIDSLLNFAKDSLIILDPSQGQLESDTIYITPSLEELISKGRKFTFVANEIMINLQESLDTIRLTREIPAINETLASLRERTKTPNTQFNFRYINALLRILEGTEKANNELDIIVQNRLDELNNLDSLLGILKKDDLFKYKIRDTLLLPMYSGEIQNLKKNIYVIDSTLYRQELQAARFQSLLSNISLSILELNRYVEANKTFLEKNLLKKEINFIWESYSIPSPKSILDITRDSIRLNFLLLKRQLVAKPFVSVLALILLFLGSFWMRKLVRGIERDKEYGKIILGRIKYLSKEPIAAVMVALLPLIYFMFDIGSITLLTFFIYLQAFFSSWLIYSNFPIRTFIRWVILVVIFIFFTISNLYWEIAYQERMYFQIGNVIFMLILWRIPTTFTSDDPKEVGFLKKLRTLSMVFLSFGILSNILGRFSLAKILSVAGTVSFIHAITIFLFVKVIMEIIYILLENKKDSDVFTSYLDFKSIQERIKGIFVFLGILFWVIILLHNLALNDYVYDALEEILITERVLGETSFTFRSILLFGVLVYVSYLLANNIAYFASIKDQQYSSNRTKRLGSSILLIRLAIFILGFIIAATAAKIPLNNITIVLGALSVGIGFGLQTIINNLVSGIILAFERPIQIGDDIEVGLISGQVKEVGIRASKILSYDGAEIVIPNGDLLSQSLINWTLSDKKRRIELIIGVSYDSDMEKVKSLIQEILIRDRILKTPPPRILMQNFNESSVDFRVLFWIESMDILLEMRNEVMNAIFKSFKENEIEIPYPKRDLYLKTLPAELGKNQDQKKSPES